MAQTILVADDSASMRLSMRLLLENWHPGLLIREASDGLDAIKQAEKLQPDLVLLDLRMPGLNGAEVASALRTFLPKTPIIIFTMFSELFSDTLWSTLGVEFLEKTGDITKLLQRVDALLPRSC
jgi:CheY-like chemotaxis protein